MHRWLIVAIVVLSGCKSTPKQPTSLQPDLNRPVIVVGCEQAKERDKDIDC